jgi:hypothetical protein
MHLIASGNVKKTGGAQFGEQKQETGLNSLLLRAAAVYRAPSFNALPGPDLNREGTSIVATNTVRRFRVSFNGEEIKAVWAASAFNRSYSGLENVTSVSFEFDAGTGEIVGCIACFNGEPDSCVGEGLYSLRRLARDKYDNRDGLVDDIPL